MGHTNASASCRQIRDQLRQTTDLPFACWLPHEQIEGAIAVTGMTFRDRIFNPVVTVWTFLSQVLSADQSCRNAVARLIAWRVSQGQPPCSPDTSSYCDARKRLPLPTLQTLLHQTAQPTPEPAWLWKGRHVKIADGSSATAADTPANQQAFPQSTEQKPGLGFPMVRIVVLFSLAYATVLDVCCGPMRGRHCGETSLFRKLWRFLQPGDIVLADSVFESYRDIAELQKRGVDVVMRRHGSRKSDFRRGRWLGVGDHLVTRTKPRFNPHRFDRADYAALPDQMTVREVRYRVATPGYRTEEVVLVTTLLDATIYRKDDLTELYAQRWHCELDFNALKTTMQLRHVDCKTPAMVEKTIVMHLLAYNLLRRIMAEAARMANCAPRQLSVKAALQLINAFAEHLTRPNTEHLICELLHAIAHHRVGDRPGRIEPRKIKRRFARYPRLTQPRTLEQQRLAA
jgi:DDE family transposase